MITPFFSILIIFARIIIFTFIGLDDQKEKQLLDLGELLKKINRNKKNLHLNKITGYICITKKRRKCFSLEIGNVHEIEKDRKKVSTMNEEWLYMFGSAPKLLSTEDVEGGSIPVAYEAHEYSRRRIDCPPCQNDLSELIVHKNNNIFPPLIVSRLVAKAF